MIGQTLVLVPLLWAWRFGGSLPQVMSLGLLLGVAGGSFSVALPLASRWYPPEHQGLAVGIAGAGNSGTVLAALFAPRLAERFGWHAIFGLALIPAVVTLLAFTLLARESPGRPESRRLSGYLRILKQGDLLKFCLVYGFTFGGFVGLASYLVILFHDQYGVARVTAGTMTAACVFAGSFLRPVGGYFADRWGGRKILWGVVVLASLALAGVGLQPTLAVGAPLLFLAMGFLGAGNGAVFQLVPRRFADDMGVATGIIGLCGGGAGFLIPSLLGLAMQATGSYGAGFFCISLAGAYALSVVTSLGRSESREGPLPESDSDLASSKAEEASLG